MSQMYLNFFI